jgi:signal transduction histidine kinase
MPRQINRSISLPIVLSSVSVLLTVAVLVGWIVVIRGDPSLTRAFFGNLWLMASSIASLAAVMCVVVLFSVSLVREILEGRRQQTFIDSVSHELRSPLASIKLCLETLDRDGVSPAQRIGLRQMMQADVVRLTVFVEDILEASRITHGRRAQLWTTVDLTQLVRRAMDSIRSRYGLAVDALQLTAPAELNITTDPTALETILKNVLDNAVKYSPVPPRVDIDVRPSARGELQIRVRDRGIGVERTQLKRIFKRFHRVPSAAVNARGGTGLGLYVVAKLLRMLGGRVRAESAGVDAGTTVIISLPIGVATTEATGS